MTHRPVPIRRAVIGDAAAFARVMGHGGPDLQKAQQRIDTAPQLAQPSGMRQASIQARRAEHTQCFVHAVVEDVVHGREAAIQTLAQAGMAQLDGFSGRGSLQCRSAAPVGWKRAARAAMERERS